MLKLTRRNRLLLCSLTAAVWLFACVLAVVHGCAERPSVFVAPQAAAHAHHADGGPADSAADAGLVCAHHCQSERSPAGPDFGAALAALALCAAAILYGPLPPGPDQPLVSRRRFQRSRPFRPPLSILFQRFNN